MSTDANARGARPSLGQIRGLDGVRALLVLAIIAFHAGLSPVPGGNAMARGRPCPSGARQLDHAVRWRLRSTSRTTSGGGKVNAYDLNAEVSQASKYAAATDGVNVRCTDGPRSSPSSGLYVGERLVPELASLGQAHAASSPAGAWPGRLPASTPSWYSTLPCQ